MKGHAIPYSDEEMAWLEEHRMLPIAEYHAAFAARFGRPDVTPARLHGLRKRKGWKTGRTGHFPKGNTPHNKGKPFPVAAINPNCRKGQFKKGDEPHNTRHLGHERVSREGYVEVSVAETNPHTGYSRRYVLKHRWLWEQENGPIPDGHCLKCRDGNKANTAPDNWECIPRSLLPRLVGGNRHHHHLAYDDAPPELKPTILATARLVHATRGVRGKR